MPRYLVFPKGYDPVIAAGPPTKDYLRAGCHWTPEDTKKHKAMEAGAVILNLDPDESPVTGQWTMQVDENYIHQDPLIDPVQGEVGVGVWFNQEPVPINGIPIGNTETLTKEQIDFAEKICKVVEKTLKYSGVLDGGYTIGLYVPG